jgi:hypothetical protein
MSILVLIYCIIFMFFRYIIFIMDLDSPILPHIDHKSRETIKVPSFVIKILLFLLIILLGYIIFTLGMLYQKNISDSKIKTKIEISPITTLTPTPSVEPTLTLSPSETTESGMLTPTVYKQTNTNKEKEL